MPKEVLMPRIDPGMKSGKLVKWLKKVGDQVKKGEEIAIAEGEKTTFPIESPADGILAQILVEEGQEVPVLTPLAIVAEPGEEVAPPKVVPRVAEERIRASPAARRLAEQYGVDLSKVRGTGPGGRITREDVLRYLEERGAVVEEGPKILQEIELTGVRGTIARRLSESHREIPSVTIVMKADMSRALDLRRKMAEEDRRFSITALIVKAVAKALEEHRMLNSAVRDDRILVYEDINIGVAVSIPDGLVAPVIRRANEKSVLEISKEIEKLAEKARTAGLSPEDVMGGTFTVSNLGAEGVEIFTPIINPPQAAILGVGTIQNMPVLGESGSVEFRPMVHLCLVFDHRVVDGVPAARFLRRVVELLQTPENLV
ncbi:MAG TPA: 2-oxo acid dehydrogenase subunit E2 [Candidatus Korarchaeota archaeon]|nr:2-oxo acid dehydrogenase subunit E2 [Candidatus Korarchaeota archaeon]